MRLGRRATSRGDVQLRLDASYRNLDRVIGWVANADNKALIILTFQGAITAGLVAAAGFIRTELYRPRLLAMVWLLRILLTVFAASFCISLYQSFRTINPDVAPRAPGGEKGSPFFFGAIATMNRDEFRRRLRAMDPDSIEDELIDQTHIIAGIATRKFQRLRGAVRWLVLALVMLLAVMLILVLVPVI